VANNDFPRGLQPHGNLLHAGEYTLVAAYATNLFIGDPVIATGTDRNVTAATAGTGNPILGSVIAIYDVNKVPMSYWVGATAGVGYVVVADDPRQIFIAQDSGTALGVNGCGGNVNLVAVHSGSTFNYRSGWEINGSDTPGNTAADQIRLLRPLQAVDNDGTAASCQWLCRINNHQLMQGIVGVGV